MLKFVSDFEIIDLGIQEEWVYDIEVEENHNFFANKILVHNSQYLSLQKIIKKKFPNYQEKDRMEVVEFIDKYMDKRAQVLARDRLDNMFSYTFNAFLPEKMLLDREIIADKFISIAPKMYFTRIYDNEGVKLTKHKMKVTGLSMIRSNTPKFFRDKLKQSLDILIEGNIDKIIEFIENVKNELYSQSPKDLSINVSVSSINYKWNEDKKAYLKWTGEKFLSAPINSRASIKHNEFIERTESRNKIRDIQEGEKISYIHLIEPNPARTDTIAFKDSKIFEIENLKDYIDYNTMFEKCFISNIKLITDPLNWELISSDSKVSDDDW